MGLATQAVLGQGEFFPEADMIAFRVEDADDFPLVHAGSFEDDNEGAETISAAVLLDPFQAAENDHADGERDEAEAQLAAADAEAEHGGEPEGGSGGDADGEVFTVNNRARADEAHAGEDAEGETHEIEDDIGVRGLARDAEEFVDFDHAERGGQADEHGGAQASRATPFAAIEADDGPGEEGEAEAEGEVKPSEGGGHRDGRGRFVNFARGRWGVNRLEGERGGFLDGINKINRRG